MKLKHFRVGCFSLCLWCLLTDGVFQGSDSAGFSVPLNHQQEKNNIETFRLFCMGQRQKQKGWNQLSLPKSDQQKVIWFGSRCRFLWYHQAIIQLYTWQSYIPGDWSTSKSVSKHLYGKNLSQKVIHYIHTGIVQAVPKLLWVRCMNYQLVSWLYLAEQTRWMRFPVNLCKAAQTAFKSLVAWLTCVGAGDLGGKQLLI